MVPRAFAATSPPRLSPAGNYDEKRRISVHTRQIPGSPTSRSPSPTKSRTQSRSPSHGIRVREKENKDQHTLAEKSLPPQRPPQAPVQIPVRRDSPQDILAATAIPIRRKPKKRTAQRLPEGDHVANFSSLLQEDLRATPPGSYIAQFDGLFGSIDGSIGGGQMFVGSEGLDSSILRTRSASTESMPSLASPGDSSVGGNSATSPWRSRSPSYRKIRHVASSEDCALEHPLMSDEEGTESTTPELLLTPTRKDKQNSGQRRASTFKSTLTASLKAIKSAAQSVSNYATPFNEADMFSTTPFDIRPSLTDDRRPPPSSEVPSPALRRYLNPNISAPPDSPAQLHFWTEHRASRPRSNPQTPSSSEFPSEAGFRTRPKKKSTQLSKTTMPLLPPVVPLATCIPSAVRTAHASSPPIWLAPDGTPTNKQTATPLLFEVNGPLKQREPRENRDFLRVFVCEMGMKRAGKLKLTAEGHARMWLPPVGEERGKRARRLGRERWGVWIKEGERVVEGVV